MAGEDRNRFRCARCVRNEVLATMVIAVCLEGCDD